MRTIASFLLSAALAAGVAGCGTDKAEPASQAVSSVTTDEAPAPAPRPADGTLADLRAPLTDLGGELVTAGQDEKGNAVISPVSVAFAFGLLREGARANSAAQIDTAFGLPGNGTALLRELADTLTGAPETTVKLSNHVMLRDDFTARPEFLEALDKHHVEHATYHEPQDGADTLNSWADRSTNGLIKRVVSPNDLADAPFTLSNATYFKGTWSMQQQAPLAFTTAGGEQTYVPAFGETLHTQYAPSAKLTAVKLPYDGGTYSLWVLLPRKGGDPAALLNNDTLDGLNWQEGLVRVSMPTFTVESRDSLVEPLQKQGLAELFDTRADLSGIAGQPGDLFVDNVIHNAKIVVDEDGTEAAAVTVIVAGKESAFEPEKPFEFTADRPFAYVIMHEETGTPLFLGTVGDPR